MKLILCSLLAFFSLWSYAEAQNGCTDPLATNYDVDAITNDGSCEYPATSYTLQSITNLPAILRETSGLAYFANGLWTLNDTNNPNEIYQLDTLTGEVLNTTVLDTFSNVDWEEMAEDDLHLYIGDFGNNGGNRRNLRILRVNKSEVAGDTVGAEEIRFSFSDQTDFSLRPNNHNFDCEAFIHHGDSLHLFTKNWSDNQTRHYTLPDEPGEYTARLKETFDAGGLVTAADINQQGVLVLLGYQGLNNFLWVLFDYPDDQFFAGNKRRIELGLVLNNSQTEGLTFDTDQGGYISAEELSSFGLTVPQQLFRFSIDQWTAPDIVNIEGPIVAEAPSIGPNPFTSQLWINWPTDFSLPVELCLVNQYGQQVGIRTSYTPVGGSRQDSGFQLEGLSAGIYYLFIRQGEYQWIYQLIKNAG